jgi:4-hydroxy-2-oxoheptanedioate aldolase
MNERHAAKAAPLFGPIMKCPHPEMVESIALAGFDFALVDMEHTPLGPRDLYPLVLAAEARGFSLAVRIPAREEQYFKWCRDLNIRRIQVPFVEAAEDVLYAVKNCLFSPLGERGLCRFVRAADFSAKSRDEYLAYANGSIQLILQVEGKRGVDNLDEILAAAPTGSVLFIGPYDLSQSLGKPGQIWDDEVVKIMEGIVVKCAERGIGVGVFTDTVAGAKFWSDRGVYLIEYASDLNIFMSGAQSLLKETDLISTVGQNGERKF